MSLGMARAKWVSFSRTALSRPIIMPELQMDNYTCLHCLQHLQRKVEEFTTKILCIKWGFWSSWDSVCWKRSQDCVSHRGLVLHETHRSCFGADIEAAGVGSILDSCLPVGIAGKSQHNNWQHFWQAESEYNTSIVMNAIWSHRAEAVLRKLQDARYCLWCNKIESSASGSFVAVLKPQLLYLTDCPTLE